MKVKLKKTFKHEGIAYEAGSTFDGTADEVDLLVRQGFADAPETEEKAQAHQSEPPKKTASR